MNPLFRKILERKHRRFLIRCSSARKNQKEFLQNLINRNRGTAFGQQFGFHQISDHRQFAHQVPIQSYSGFEPWIERILRGERNVLCQEPVGFCNLTSGTDKSPKLIPITGSYQRTSRNLLNAWVGALVRDHPGCMSESRLAIPGKAIEFYSEGGIPVGSASGEAYKSALWFIRNKYAVPYDVFEIDDFKLRYLLILRFALQRKLSFLATPNSGTLVRLISLLQEESETILRSLYDGGLPGYTFEPEQEKRIRKLCPPDRKTANRLLKNINSGGGSFQPLQYWDSIQAIAVWLGGSCGTQVGALRTLFPGIPLRDLGYHASEARMTMPVSDNTSEGLLATDNNFYEFIPVHEYEAGSVATCTIAELEAGQEYHIVITNSSGLYRYDIGDIVQVTGFHRQTPIVRFLRKGRDYSNMAGEKLHINQFLEAKRIAVDARCVPLRDDRFLIFPNQDAFCYDLFFELAPSEHSTDLKELALEFDMSLKELNVEYASKRDSGRLNRVRIFDLDRGTIQGSVDADFQAGMRDSQYKYKFYTAHF